MLRRLPFCLLFLIAVLATQAVGRFSCGRKRDAGKAPSGAPQCHLEVIFW
ncbi:MAG: hypothetical protein ABIO17_13240 [Pseudoxanthomonas sp.]